MICDICGKEGAEVLSETRSFGKGASRFLIEDVPVVSCRSCAESFMTAETLHEIERIRAHWRELAVEEKILVVKFGAGT